MKRNIFVGTIMMVLIAIAITLSSCSPQSQSQIKAIAQQAGLFSAVGWIAIDNPPPAVKSAVTGIIVLIGDKVGNIEAGQTYTEVLYPVVLQYVVENVDVQYRPLTKAGAVALLGAIDMLFAANPSVANQQTFATQVVKAFCLGAQSGLNMSTEDPIMKAALNSAELRSGLKLKN